MIVKNIRGEDGVLTDWYINALLAKGKHYLCDLEAEHNVTLVRDHNKQIRAIKFKSEGDMLMFVLRWA